MSSPTRSDDPGASSGPSWAAWALAAVAVVLGSAWRLAHVGSPFLFGDEFHSLRDLAGGFRHVFTNFSDTGSGMALPILVRALGEIFGYNHWSIRAPAWLGGIATLAVVFPLARRQVGDVGAAVATCLVATSPLLIFYSHFGRSYTLVTLACLLLWAGLQRIVDGAPASLARLIGCALLCAVLPYLHPIAVGFIGPVAGGAVVALAVDPQRRRVAATVAVCIATGLGLSVLAHAPAWESIQAYIHFQRSTDYYAAVGWIDVAALTVGNRFTTLIVLAVLPAALAATLSRRGWRGLPLVLGVLGPCVVLVFARPFGGPYAYARYLIPAIPFACIAVGDLVVIAFERIHGTRWQPLALTAGAAIAGVLFFVGPYGRNHTDDGPYANTYITMYPLPAFDTPWDAAPAYYDELNARDEDLRIIEVPALVTRTRHLYRNSYLRHRKETLLGFAFDWELPVPPDGPYVSFQDPNWRERADADILILHTGIGRELRRYWNFVRANPAAAEAGVAGYMDRQQRYGGYAGPFATVPASLREQLYTELGKPDFADSEIIVWRLR